MIYRPAKRMNCGKANAQRSIRNNVWARLDAGARRRGRRFLVEGRGKSVCLRQKPKTRRRNQIGTFFGRRKFKLLHLCCEFPFLFGFFPSGNRFAQAARMFAVECLLYRLREGRTADVLREHPRPRNGLKQGPMRPRRCEHSQDHQRIAKPSEHGTIITTHCSPTSKMCYPPK